MIPPTFKTKRYIIGLYREKDESRFLETALDDEVIKFMGGANGDINEEKDTFKRIFEVYEKEQVRWFWIWGVFEEDKLCAHIELKQSQHTVSNELEIVYMVHPAERRKGLMTEVLNIFKENQYAWNKTIIATVDHDNVCSIALLEKWGIEKKEILFDEETGKKYLKCILSGA